MSKTLGSLTRFEDLSAIEQTLVRNTWKNSKHAYVPRSEFPVGSALLMANDAGKTRIFNGCNVEGRHFPQTICGERNAITTAVAAGYRKLLAGALVCAKYQGPGASPCGLCRQVLIEFGCDAVFMNLAGKDNSVYRFYVRELLPAASQAPVSFDQLSDADRFIVRTVRGLVGKSYVPYSQAPGAAVFVASDASDIARVFEGVNDDNASYGGSALAACVAMRSARTAGFVRNVTLAVTVQDPSAPNPVEGECLQVLREFGTDSKVMLVGPDDAVVFTDIEELLPDSFGPQSLA